MRSNETARVSEAAGIFVDCAEWCLSHWLTAIDYENLRQQAAEDEGAFLVREYADKCEVYEDKRDKSWAKARPNGFVLIAAARTSGMSSNAIELLLRSLGEYELLPGVCGIRLSSDNQPPEFKPAIKEAKAIAFEAEIRSSGSAVSTASQADWIAERNRTVDTVRSILETIKAVFSQPPFHRLEQFHNPNNDRRDILLIYLHSVRNAHEMIGVAGEIVRCLPQSLIGPISTALARAQRELQEAEDSLAGLDPNADRPGLVRLDSRIALFNEASSCVDEAMDLIVAHQLSGGRLVGASIPSLEVEREVDAAGVAASVKPGVGQDDGHLCNAEPVLDEIDHAILEALSKKPSAMKLEDLAVAAGYDRGTCGDHVKRLIVLGYADRKSPRSGVAVTANGRNRITAQDQR